MTSDPNGLPRADAESQLRERAMKRLREKREFLLHLVIYLAVNVLLVVLWASSEDPGFFWPIFPILGWGIGVFSHGWTVYRGQHFSEDRIRREMDRMRGTG
ncbi:2TM domain-containing protein [Rothia sp. AR01]|uniref:2TM domain-containing protein n=1 Tax=Rothia santali TaxID=2949643 RepID=A0A9X2KIA2_9MICC|nr:2TM domain-containing protein [Rothia santali]MCP3425993.1 2TM domain-containing protein [Rothia santali]